MKLFNKKVISLALTLLLILGALPISAIGCKAASVCTNGHNYARKVNSVAHRGYGYGAPENTLPAYTMAKEKGFYYVECDVTYSSDRVPVLMHLEDISHTSNGTGLVSQLTYNQLLKYDYGSWKGQEFKGTKIPTFEEFIAHCAELDLHPYIELKDHGNHTRESIKELINIVKKYDMLRQCTWITFIHDYCFYICEFDPYARVGLLWPQDVNASIINKANSIKTSTNEVFLDVSYSSLTDSGVQRAKSNGYPIEVYTINDTETLLNMSEYISGVTSDKIVAQSVFNTAVGKVTAPTCEEGGYTTYTCVNCGYENVTDFTEALGHDYDENGECWRCELSGSAATYFVYQNGSDSNNGASSSTPLATINKAVELALARGATKGDTVTVKVLGNVKFGSGITSITKHDFTLLISSDKYDYSGSCVTNDQNLSLGGPTIFDKVIIHAGGSWKYFGFGGNSVTFDGLFTFEQVDVHLGNGANTLNVNEEVNTNINGFIRKLGLGNTWNNVNYYQDYNLNFNGTDGDPDSAGYLLSLGAIQSGKTIYHKALNITNERVEPFQFTNGSSLVLETDAYFNFINNATNTTINRSSLGLSSSALSKTWVLNNKSASQKVTPTNTKGKFAVEKGYIATARKSNGSTVKSSAGFLTLSADQYSITFTECKNHTYTNSTDINCNNCGLDRELNQSEINGCTLKPTLASGTVNGNVGVHNLENCVGAHSTRLYTVNTYKVTDINEIIVGDDCRIFVQFFDEFGDYIGGSSWQGTGTHIVADMSSADKATYFKVTFSSTLGGADATTPQKERLTFTLHHVYDNDTDASCNNCGALREIKEEEKPCAHSWGAYVSDGNANCTTLGTETRQCQLCNVTETRKVDGKAPGHTYDNACDISCDVCGNNRVVSGHSYSNELDKFCDICMAERQITGETLIKEDGIWYYYKDGEKANDTTLVKYSGKWFYVENGVWIVRTTLVEYKGKTFYIKGGKWDSSLEDTLYKIDGKWYYIVNGKLAEEETTLVKYSGKWFYIENGTLSFETRFVEYKGVTFYIKGGKWNKEINTLIKVDGKYRYVKSGKWNFEKAIVSYKGKKFFVNKGYAQLDYSGKVKIGSETYKIKNGKVV